MMEAYEERLRVLKLYMQECVRHEDWHGVRDTATDIEIAMASIAILKEKANENVKCCTIGPYTWTAWHECQPGYVQTGRIRRQV